MDTLDPRPDLDEAAFGLGDFIEEQVLLLGAGPAIMHQLAMKGVGLGVAEHSTTLDRPLDRLRTTLTYVYGMVLGTEEEKQAIARMVNRAHVPVRSTGRYSAYDPELQLWVAATLAREGSVLYEKVFGELDAPTRERVYRETWIYGTALQVKPESWPQTRAAFDDYWATSLKALEPDPAVQAYVGRLLGMRGQPWSVRPLMPLQSFITRGLTEPAAREVLGLSWSRREQVLLDWFWRLFVPIYRRTPRRLRTLTARSYMKDFRRRTAAGTRVI